MNAEPMTGEEMAQLAAGLPAEEYDLPQATRTRRLLATVEARDTEIARLRVALRRIVNDTDNDGVACAERWEGIARRALMKVGA